MGPKIFLTQRRKGAKIQRLVDHTNLCVFASLRLCVEKLSILFIFILLLPSASPLLHAQETDKLMQEGFTDGVTLDLKNPVYADGRLSTEEGGVLIGPNVRIQALKIRYAREAKIVEAEEQIILEFGDYIFVGDSLVYDFEKKEGVVYNARTGLEPWYFGGEVIELRSDGSYLITKGYFTTSESIIPDWDVSAQSVVVAEKQYLTAEHIKLRFFQFPVLSFPKIRANLDSIFNSPIRYRIKWGGRQGPRFGLTYEVFSWERWKVFFRFDYRITRGPGGGLEFRYRSLDGKTEFQSMNYVANDSSLSRPHENMRYRFEGRYRTLWMDDRVSVLMTYDKISDLDMPSDSIDQDFELGTSERTQLLVRRQEEDWIGMFYSRVRVNNFQTVKQELPTLSGSLRPFVLGRTGIIVENKASASYLDFKYASNLDHVHDYASTRLEYRPRLYRPIVAGPLTVTPELGGIAIFYGNSPDGDSKALALGSAGVEFTTSLYKYYRDDLKHVINPYLAYHFYTAPTVSPHDHYIFDINDGWYRLNMCTFGIRNNIFRKCGDCVSLPFTLDLYAHAFINTPTVKAIIPKVYSIATYRQLPTLRHTLDVAWDFVQHQLDHINIRSDWTLNRDCAVAAEYRHRDSFSWRKVDNDNFFLDTFRSIESLRHSSLSDRRDTLLIHLFYRFHPKWACEVISRQGWHRLTEPRYSEYEIDLLTTIRTAWHLKLSYQHREHDDRVALYFNIGLRRPDPTCLDEAPLCQYD